MPALWKAHFPAQHDNEECRQAWALSAPLLSAPPKSAGNLKNAAVARKIESTGHSWLFSLLSRSDLAAPPMRELLYSFAFPLLRINLPSWRGLIPFRLPPPAVV